MLVVLPAWRLRGAVTGAIVEAASASDTINVGFDYSSTVAEAATANALQDGNVPVTFATFDGTPTNATLSNGNLTATASSGATGGARSTAQKTTGKYYFEITIPIIVEGCQSACGVVTSAGTYTNMANDGTNSTEILTNSGTIFSNNTTNSNSVGMPVDNDLIGVAIDLDNRRGWFRRNGGNWNGNATNNPATNTGGVPIQSAVSFAPAVAFGSSHATGDRFTANFGGTAFSGAVPSGFTSGWPA
jgi:SPRY domain-containing protein